MQWKDGSVATLSATLRQPCGLSLDRLGNIFVTEANGGDCVSRLNSRGEVVQVTGTTRGVGYQGGPASQAALKSPYGVVVAEDDTVYVADTSNHVIRKIAQGELLTVAGSGTADFKDGSPSQACFCGPFGLVLMRDGSIIVSDHSNHRIRKVSPQGEVFTLAGSGQGANQDGPSTGASFCYRAVVMGPNDQYVLVGDNNGFLRKVSLADGRVSTIASGFTHPSGLLVDCRGNVIVADYKNQICFCTPLDT